MQALTHCPGCHAILVKKTIPEEFNNMKYENCSLRCKVDYFQYFEKSYQDEVQYINFYTPDEKFHVYWYPKHGALPEKQLHAYSSAEMDRKGIATPCIDIKDFELDITNLERLQEKLMVYMVFG